MFTDVLAINDPIRNFKLYNAKCSENKPAYRSCFA